MAQKMDEYKRAAVLLAVRSGAMSRSCARQQYNISDDNFTTWEQAFNEEGIVGLKDRRLSARRHKEHIITQAF